MTRPDRDPQWEDADSTVLLRRVTERLTQAGWRILNTGCHGRDWSAAPGALHPFDADATGRGDGGLSRRVCLSKPRAMRAWMPSAAVRASPPWRWRRSADLPPTFHFQEINNYAHLQQPVAHQRGVATDPSPPCEVLHMRADRHLRISAISAPTPLRISLRRVILYNGLRVTQVMNLTDIDDKTICGAQEKGVPLKVSPSPISMRFSMTSRR